MNPDMEIYFSLVTKSNGVNLKYSNLTSALTSYPNVHFRFLNPVEFSKGTPLEEFFAQNKMQKSTNPIEHLSDVVRVLLLNRFGGQYLDLDVLSLMPISVINRNNFACPETKNIITNAIINMDLEGGKAISQLYLEYFFINFLNKFKNLNYFAQRTQQEL
jgi:Glycosyltransferase sugar-binding region containing DXD motif